MRATKIFCDENGDSRFEDFDIALKDCGDIGFLSDAYSVKEIIFRETTGGYDFDFHNAPAKQFVIMLEGEVDITTSLGETRRFVTGDILLAADTTGKGHISKAVDGQPRKSIFVTLED